MSIIQQISNPHTPPTCLSIKLATIARGLMGDKNLTPAMVKVRGHEIVWPILTIAIY